MRLIPCVIDTNVIVAGLITNDADSPTARILDGMLDGTVVYLMSAEFLSEYAAVLQRPKIARAHQLEEKAIDTLLTELVANSIWRELSPASNGPVTGVPDPNDGHLWSLLKSYSGSLLVTGDQLLIDNPPEQHSVMSARSFVSGAYGL